MNAKTKLFIVDDDIAMSKALAGVGNLMGFETEVFHSADEFLASYHDDEPGCLILDYKLPDASGLDLQKKLNELGTLLPVIMISGHAGVSTVVQAMRDGAVTFLEKPFVLDELCCEIESAMELNEARRLKAQMKAEVQSKLFKLTEKEREVLELVTKGKTNKEIAKFLGLSIRAVEDRRARMMKKLEADDLSDLIELSHAISSIDQDAIPRQLMRSVG